MLKYHFPRIYNLENNKNIPVKEKLNRDSLLVSFRRHPRGGAESLHWEGFSSLIESISLSLVPNRWVWSLSVMGDYMVSSARSYIDEKTLLVSNSTTRWIKEFPIKINVFAWRLSLDKLPTMVILYRRGLDLPSL